MRSTDPAERRPVLPGKALAPRLLALLASAVLVGVQAGCERAPAATPQPSASATATGPAATQAPTLAPPTPTATLAAATATIPPTAVQASATPAAARRPVIPLPTPPTPLPEGWPPPAPTPAAVHPEPTPYPHDVAGLVTSLVVTPDEPPVYYLVLDGRLYRSADKGSSWSEEARSGLPPDARLNFVTIDYKHPETMYAATTGGIYRRQRQGEWGLVNPNNPNVLWAVGNHPAPALWRGGRDGHWERLDLSRLPPVCESGDCCYPSGMAYDPNAGLLFVGCHSSGRTGRSLLLRSPNADAADSSTVRWEAVTSLPAEAAQAFVSTRPLAVDAREPRSLFVATSSWESGVGSRYRLLVSHDHGATWQPLRLDGLPQTPGQ